VPAAVEAQNETGAWYSYAVLRVVPSVEREEFVNVGVVLFARELQYLELRLALDESRLLALSPSVDLRAVREHLEIYRGIAAGEDSGGPIASLSQSERFHWLTSPRSTIIQTSAVHVGRCTDPAAAVEDLMREFVLPHDAPRPA
jgi:hypothetical protein